MAVKRTSTGARAPKRRKAFSRDKASTLELVREGVRHFILNDTSIGDFHTLFRGAVRKGELSPNPLTGAAFRRIVKQAINEQKRKSARQLRREKGSSINDQ